MSLSERLSILTGNQHSTDARLSGVHTSETYNPEIESDEDLELEMISISSYMSSGKSTKKSKKKSSGPSTGILDSMSSRKKKRSSDPFEEESLDLSVEGNLKGAVRDFDIFDSSGNFDAFLDERNFEDDQNDAIANNLISIGRKYARDNATTVESSEINKTFAESEKRLDKLYGEVVKAKTSLLQDLDRARLPQRGSIKMISELNNSLISMFNAEARVIEAGTKIRKDKLELRNKEQAKKDLEANGNSDISTNTIQSIFSSARSDMMTSMGGYSAVSGSTGEISSSSDNYDDDAIQRAYFANREETEGDKYLKYEDLGVELVAVVEDDKVTYVFAEDRDGNIVGDYPVPTNIEELTFEIDTINGTARDNMYRTYKLRI